LFLLIVLGALAYALARRRRNRVVYDEEAYEPEPVYAEPEAAAEPVYAEPEPVAVRQPIAEEQPAIVAPEVSAFAWGRPDAGRLETPAAAREEAEEERPSTLPNGFDLSRFGPHVQAAYRGPTPDNPSLSLRHRLRRAAAMDQRERAMGVREDNTAVERESITETGEMADA
jgi:hypothetical protein